MRGTLTATGYEREIFPRRANGEQRLAARIVDRNAKGAALVADRLKAIDRKNTLIRITGRPPLLIHVKKKGSFR